jgi:hypothetical protein
MPPAALPWSLDQKALSFITMNAMTKRTFHGSCHCGRVRYEVDLDLAAGTTKCNCSICSKTRWWGALVKPEAFRLIAGEEALADYQFGSEIGHGRFCRNCGVRPFNHGVLELLGGAFYAINLGCLDDVDPAELAAAPVRCTDGRNDAWHVEPAVTSHL